MKLELKHIAPYLPYQLKFTYKFKGGWGSLKNTVDIMDSHSIAYIVDDPEDRRVFLRPLSDLTKRDDENRPLYFPSKSLLNLIECKQDILTCDYNEINYLIRNQFDVFDLIPKGLALDINSLKIK